VNTRVRTSRASSTVNLMTMDYGAPGQFVCVIANGTCDMASRRSSGAEPHAHHAIPFNRIEITPMIGGNDVQSNVFRLADVNTVASFVIQTTSPACHYWSYDRDIDCPPGSPPRRATRSAARPARILAQVHQRRL